MPLTIEGKAAFYLTEGRIKAVAVSESAGVFHAQGSGKEPYVVRFNGTWACTCPARVERCAHIVAVQTITDFQSDGTVSLKKDDDLDALLGTPASASQVDLDGYDPFADM
jgi:uncharacterized Zn finger protein